jgi:hypothetical protein
MAAATGQQNEREQEQACHRNETHDFLHWM